MFSVRKFATAALLASVFPVFELGAETFRVDFDSALTNATGWVYGEKVKIRSEKPKNAYFAGAGVRIVSPGFDRPVTSFVLEYRSTNAGNPRGLSAVPVFDGTDADESLHRAIPGFGGGTNATYEVSWPKEAGVRAFALVSGGGTGNLHVFSGEIALADDYLPVPFDLETTAVYGNGFHAAWKLPEGAEAGVFRLWHREVEEERYTAAVWAPDFSGLVNAGGNPAAFGGFGDGSGAGFTKIFLPASSAGTLQFGTGEDYGMLELPPAESEAGRTLMMEVRAYGSKTEHSLLVEWEAGGETGLVARLEFGDVPTKVRTSLDAVPAGARVRIRTATKTTGRFLVTGLAVVEGYEP